MSKSVLRRMAVQLNLPFPSTLEGWENLSKRITEQEVERQRALEEHVNSDTRACPATQGGRSDD